jgi:hypothetical protein
MERSLSAPGDLSLMVEVGQFQTATWNHPKTLNVVQCGSSRAKDDPRSINGFIRGEASRRSTSTDRSTRNHASCTRCNRSSWLAIRRGQRNVQLVGYRMLLKLLKHM